MIKRLLLAFSLLLMSGVAFSSTPTTPVLTATVENCRDVKLEITTISTVPAGQGIFGYYWYKDGVYMDFRDDRMQTQPLATRALWDWHVPLGETHTYTLRSMGFTGNGWTDRTWSAYSNSATVTIPSTCPDMTPPPTFGNVYAPQIVKPDQRCNVLSPYFGTTTDNSGGSGVRYSAAYLNDKLRVLSAPQPNGQATWLEQTPVWHSMVPGFDYQFKMSAVDFNGNESPTYDFTPFTMNCAADGPHGTRQIAIVFIDFSDNTSQPFTLIEGMNSYNAFANVIAEESYGALTVPGSGFGWAIMPHPRTYYCTINQNSNLGQNCSSQMKVDALALADTLRDPAGYYDTWLVYNGIGDNIYWTAQGNWGSGSITHEFGHFGIGLGHGTRPRVLPLISYTMQNSQGQAICISGSSCTGFPYDPMIPGFGTGARYYDVLHREVAGWIPMSDVKTVTASETIALTAVESATGTGWKEIRIPLPKPRYFYSLEYVQGINLNSGSTAGVYATEHKDTYFAPEDEKNGFDSLFDQTPLAPFPLPVGTAYTDPWGNSFTVQSLNGGTATVVVTAPPYVILPTSDVSPNGYVPVPAGAHYAVVDDATPNGDTDYLKVYSNSSESYGLGISALPDYFTAIGSVQVVWTVKNDSIDDAVEHAGLKIGGVDYWGTDRYVYHQTAYTTFTETYATNPATGAAWTKAALGAAILRHGPVSQGALPRPQLTQLIVKVLP